MVFGFLSGNIHDADSLSDADSDADNLSGADSDADNLSDADSGADSDGDKPRCCRQPQCLCCRFPDSSITPKFHVMIYEHCRMLKQHGFCGMMTEEVAVAHCLFQ